MHNSYLLPVGDDGIPVLPPFILMLLVQRGWSTPYSNLYGEAPPGQGYLFRLQVFERDRDFANKSV